MALAWLLLIFLFSSSEAKENERCPTLDSSNLGSIECVTGIQGERCSGRCWSGYHFEFRPDEEEITLTCSSGVWKPWNAFPRCKRKNSQENLMVKPKDCAELVHMGHNRSGVYTIWPVSRMTENKHVYVYCDMETNGGGWTVIQRRGNFGKPKDYFYKDWKSYREGFGDLAEDFWLGNDNIFALTNQKVYSGRFDLQDAWKNKKYALYDTFWIDDEYNKYRIHLSGFSGDAGDSMIPMHNNNKFTTKDQRNDDNKAEDCALLYKGAWWYNSNGCHLSNLNGLYLLGKHESFADGVNWFSWKGLKESLEWTEIKVRPKSFTVRISYDPPVK